MWCLRHRAALLLLSAATLSSLAVTAYLYRAEDQARLAPARNIILGGWVRWGGEGGGSSQELPLVVQFNYYTRRDF